MIGPSAIGSSHMNEIVSLNPQRTGLLSFSFFSYILQNKTLVSRIETRIVGVEGEHADHLTWLDLTTTTTAKLPYLLAVTIVVVVSTDQNYLL